MEGLLEVGAREDDDGGAVAEQAAHAHDDREDPLEDGAPDVRRPRHSHAAGQVARRRSDVIERRAVLHAAGNAHLKSVC